jgi:hypothetical protein
MKIRTSVILAIAGIMALMNALDVCAQTYVNQPPAGQAQPAPSGARFTAAQLDQMLAPIALYPDALLGQILMASTYPLEIVEADRWVKSPRNAALTGSDLDNALKSQPWDPSVKSLVPFPQILHMMDNNLSWTEQLGDAFLAEQPAVMDSVQHLRKEAEAAGNLRSTHYETVTTEGSEIIIEPAEPDIVFVPVYDPFVVFGAWPFPAFPPFFFPGFFDVDVVVVGGVGFFGVDIDRPFWGWNRWDWDRHEIFVDRDRFNEINVSRLLIAIRGAMILFTGTASHIVTSRRGTGSRREAECPIQTVFAATRWLKRRNPDPDWSNAGLDWSNPGPALKEGGKRLRGNSGRLRLARPRRRLSNHTGAEKTSALNPNAVTPAVIRRP